MSPHRTHAATWTRWIGKKTKYMPARPITAPEAPIIGVGGSPAMEAICARAAPHASTGYNTAVPIFPTKALTREPKTASLGVWKSERS